MKILGSILAGLVCGVISGFGIGGGSLLMVWMTAVMSMQQQAAQSINLLYFLPTAAGALLFHIKNRQICKKVIFPAAVCGCLAAALGAWMANSVSPGLLRRLFGGFLILVGISELLKKQKKET